MDIPPLLTQFGASLIAIAALYWLARAMGLGGDVLLTDEADIANAAGEVEDGFEPHESEISQDGTAALAMSADGRIMLIKRHGNRFAGRILNSHAKAKRSGDQLTIDCGEARFGPVRLRLKQSSAWAERVNNL